MPGPTEDQMRRKMEALSDELESKNEDFKVVLMLGSLAAWLAAVCGLAWLLSGVVVAAGAVFADVVVTAVYLATVFVFICVLYSLRMLVDAFGNKVRWGRSRRAHPESAMEDLGGE